MAVLPPYINIFHRDEFCHIDKEVEAPIFRPTHYSFFYHFVVRTDQIEQFKHLALESSQDCHCCAVGTEHSRVRVFTRTQFLELDTLFPSRDDTETLWKRAIRAEQRRLLGAPPNVGPRQPDQ
jgi:hypothetical protein